VRLPTDNLPSPKFQPTCALRHPTPIPPIRVGFWPQPRILSFCPCSGLPRVSLPPPALPSPHVYFPPRREAPGAPWPGPQIAFRPPPPLCEIFPLCLRSGGPPPFESRWTSRWSVVFVRAFPCWILVLHFRRTLPSALPCALFFFLTRPP